MSQEFKYNAIVLGKSDVGETDRIYSFYTREAGKIRAVGRGTRKADAKLAGNLETGVLSEIWIMKGRGLGNISGAIMAESFPGIRGNLEKLEKVLSTFRTISRIIPEGEKDERVFDLIAGYLENLEDQSDGETLTLGFLFKLLDFLGYRFQMNQCSLCQKRLEEEGNYFGFPEGGVLCPDCSRRENNKMRISVNEIKLVRIFLSNDLASFSKVKVPKENLDNLRRIIQGFLHWMG